MESPQHRARREQAIEVARKVNEAQAAARGVGPRGGTLPYQPLEKLLNIPSAPGFVIQHHTDGASYAFSVKDTLDPCRYALFSDQSGDKYEATPSDASRRRG